MHFVSNKWIPLHCSDHCSHFSNKGRGFWSRERAVQLCSTWACTWEHERGGWQKWAIETKKNSHRAIIQSPTRHLIYSSLRERNEREEKSRKRGRKRWEKRWLEEGKKKKTCRTWWAFLTLSARAGGGLDKCSCHVVVNMGIIQSAAFPKQPIRQPRPRLPKHLKWISAERKHNPSGVGHYQGLRK